MTNFNDIRLMGTRMEAFQDYDLNHSKTLSPNEAAEMPNEALASLLNEALYKYSEPENNNHSNFFNALPIPRIVSLFADPKVRKLGLSDPYFQEYTHETPEEVAVVTKQLLQTRGEKGAALADQYLLASRLPMKSWSDVFARLMSCFPDYVAFRMDLEYLPLSEEKTLLKADWNRDGRLEAREMDSLSLDDLNTIESLFIAGVCDPAHRISTDYLIGAMSELDHVRLLTKAAQHIWLVDQEQPANLKEVLQKYHTFNQITEFLNEHVRTEPKRVYRDLAYLANSGVEANRKASMLVRKIFIFTLKPDVLKLLTDTANQNKDRNFFTEATQSPLFEK